MPTPLTRPIGAAFTDFSTFRQRTLMTTARRMRRTRMKKLYLTKVRAHVHKAFLH
jgi:hypothetical protein